MANQCYLCHLSNIKPVVEFPWPIKKCRDCGLIQTLPLPSQETVNDLYRGDYWKNYSFYNSQIPAHQKYFRKKIEEIKKYRRSGKLLDIGCAVGIFLKEAKNNGFDADGVDISNHAVKECQKRGLAATTGNITIINKKNYYHVVTAFEVIEHELNPLKIIKLIKRLLKNGGLLVVTVPDSDSWSARLMGKFWFGYKNKEHLFHFNKKSLYLLLQKSGFTDIKIMKDIGRPYLFVYSLERLNYYLFKSGFLAKFILWLKKIPVVNAIPLPFNPWANLIAYAS